MRVVVVTACPTGIAHSQMAAEALERAAAERGDEITVEIRGAMGVRDRLGEAAIEGADAAIVAADVAVDSDRFEDLPLLETSVREPISDAEGVLERAADLADASDADSASADSSGDAVSNESENRDAARDFFAAIRDRFR